MNRRARRALGLGSSPEPRALLRWAAGLSLLTLSAATACLSPAVPFASIDGSTDDAGAGSCALGTPGVGTAMPWSDVHVRAAIVADINCDQVDDLIVADMARAVVYVLLGRASGFGTVYDLRLELGAVFPTALAVADLVGPEGVGADGAPELWIGGTSGSLGNGTPVLMGLSGAGLGTRKQAMLTGAALGEMGYDQYNIRRPSYLGASQGFEQAAAHLIFGGPLGAVVYELLWTESLTASAPFFEIGFADGTPTASPAPTRISQVFPRRRTAALDDLVVVTDTDLAFYANPGDGGDWPDPIRNAGLVSRFAHAVDLPDGSGAGDGALDAVAVTDATLNAARIPSGVPSVLPEGAWAWPADFLSQDCDSKAGIEVASLNADLRPDLVVLFHSKGTCAGGPVQAPAVQVYLDLSLVSGEALHAATRVPAAGPYTLAAPPRADLLIAGDFVDDGAAQSTIWTFAADVAPECLVLTSDAMDLQACPSAALASSAIRVTRPSRDLLDPAGL